MTTRIQSPGPSLSLVPAGFPGHSGIQIEFRPDFVVIVVSILGIEKERVGMGLVLCYCKIRGGATVGIEEEESTLDGRRESKI